MMYKRYNIAQLLWLNLLTVTLLCLTCTAAKNYVSPQGPKFTGSYSSGGKLFNDTLKVVSFNIQFSEKIDEAISELKNQETLKNADILLLQEMDEVGTDRIARKLHYNYVYYPATVHPQSDRNFGNSILSKWPIRNEEKIILPYDPVIGKTQRIAVSAIINVEKFSLLVYSVHTATITLSADKRLLQADSILNSISQKNNYIIVGGDFNTVFPQNIRDIEKIFSQNGFIRASRDAGTTVEKGPFNFTLDHIFAKGFKVTERGTTQTHASDHDPLWVQLKILASQKPDNKE